MEHRFIDLPTLTGRTLEGLALPWNRETRVEGQRERFAPGAATSSGEAVLNVGHDAGRLLAREPQTLAFEARDSGLFVKATLPATREADDLLELIHAGVYRGLSVEFVAHHERHTGGVRELTRATVFGLAVVHRAAYPDTTLDVRNKPPIDMLHATRGQWWR